MEHYCTAIGCGQQLSSILYDEYHAMVLDTSFHSPCLQCNRSMRRPRRGKVTPELLRQGYEESLKTVTFSLDGHMLATARGH